MRGIPRRLAVPTRKAASFRSTRSKDQVETAHAEIPRGRDRRQRSFARRLSDMLEIVQLSDRFGKDETPGRRLLRHQRIERLEGVAVEPDRDAEATSFPNRRVIGARGMAAELADALDARDGPVLDGVRGAAAEPATGRLVDRIDGPAGRHDDPVVAIARHRPGGTRRIGDSSPSRGCPWRGRPVEQIGDQFVFAAEEMRRRRQCRSRFHRADQAPRSANSRCTSAQAQPEPPRPSPGMASTI